MYSIGNSDLCLLQFHVYIIVCVYVNGKGAWELHCDFVVIFACIRSITSFLLLLLSLGSCTLNAIIIVTIGPLNGLFFGFISLVIPKCP